MSTLFAFVLLLSVLIFVHELGHFLVAKACNVKVLKFSLGFGPRLWSFRKGETQYQISALPLGGFVKMLGELPNAEIPKEDEHRAFCPPARALGGPVSRKPARVGRIKTLLERLPVVVALDRVFDVLGHTHRVR